MIKVIESTGRTLISINGIERIDESNGMELGRLIERQIKENHEIILNLNKVFYIDTEGFKILLSLKKKAELIEGKIRLMQLSGVLSDLFSLMGLCDKFDWATSDHLNDPAFAG